MMFEGELGKKMMIQQGYVPQTCTMSDEIAGPLIWSEINKGKKPCWGCNANREFCKGQPKQKENEE